jgi:hypothetical protein
MKDSQASEAALSKQMSANFTTRFGEQSDFIHGINAALAPTLAGGESRHGFSAEELAAKNTQAINATGAANANAQRAISGELAGRGGDSGLMSGVDAQIKASVTSKMASDLASKQLDITNADWATGRDQYNRSVSGEEFLAGKVIRPEEFGQLATTANDTSFKEADANNRANSQKWADIGGLVQGAVKAGVGIATGGFGSGMFGGD